MNVTGIIPARFASTRFPGKPLVMIHGQTMIQRVYEQCKQSVLNEVVVATDDQRIYDHVLSFGGRVVMTSGHHVSGTDRCLEAASMSTPVPDGVINIQGDEPFIEPAQINQVIELLLKPGVQIATLAVHITDPSWIHDPNKVKVICDSNKKAIYFSRAAIPFQKGADSNSWLNHFQYLKHVGIYGYRFDVLQHICSLPVSSLEKAESLEQLRWLENGYAVQVGLTDRESPAVDTPADLELILRSF
jgi:3-deoxy-manno-octulosonate cytidylyltransferase (CMP-KDO synthetase)